ncbi:MAG: hypothetical protein JST30_15605 [Armatimonadetes bacterium]|nr:hypothetical protein [Armatimonadota bacterium]
MDLRFRPLSALRSTKSLFLLSAVFLTLPVPAQSVAFGFDDVPAHTPLPIDVTAGGITAHLSYQFYGYSVQRADTMGFTPLGFQGNCIYPNTVFRDDLYIAFSEPLTEFSLLYSPQELACSSSATMRVTAYFDATTVGTSVTTAPGAGTWPTGQLSFSSSTPFNRVVVHYDAPPATGGDYGVIFLADQMAVSKVGGATTETLAATKQTVQLGQVDGGSMSRLAVQDGKAETLCKYLVPSMTSPFVRLTLDYTTTKTAPERIEFFTVSRMANSGMYSIRLLMFNFGWGGFDEVLRPTRIGESWQFGIGRPTDLPSAYVGADGKLQGRIEVFRSGPSATAKPCVDVDLAVMKVSG